MDNAFVKLTVLVLVAIVGGNANGQPDAAPDSDEWLIQSWQVDQGLPDSSVTAMVQTPDGYLWFGTFNGLVRFDGVEFTVLDAENTPQLPSSGVVNLHADNRGWIWVSTLKGLVVHADQRWLDFTQEPLLGDGLIRTFTERSNGDLLLTTFRGKIIEFDGRAFVQLPDPPGETGEGYWGCVDEDGQWWTVQNEFVGRWDGQQWMQMVPTSELAGVERDEIACTAAHDGGLWVLAGGNLYRFAGGKVVARRRLSKRPYGIWSLSEDSHGNLWIASYNAGMYQVPPDGPLRQWTELGGVPQYAFRFVFEDCEGNLWLGTGGRGLIRLTARRFHDFGTRDTLYMCVTSVTPAPADRMVVATYGQGLYRIDENGLRPVSIPGRPGQGRFIQSVLRDRQGRTWIGLFTEGLYVFGSTGGQFVPEGQLAGGNVIALFEDSRGRIWLSGGERIAVIDGDESRVFGPDEGLPISGVVCFAEDQDHVIWLSNTAGVYRVLDDRVVELLDTSGDPIRAVACLKAGDDGTMWMGSLTAGLLRWRGGVLATIGPDSGLPTRDVLGILDDERGYFWMASGHGVVRVARSEIDAVADGVATRLDRPKCSTRQTAYQRWNAPACGTRLCPRFTRTSVVCDNERRRDGRPG